MAVPPGQRAFEDRSIFLTCPRNPGPLAKVVAFGGRVAELVFQVCNAGGFGGGIKFDGRGLRRLFL
ncbi:MAG: hypothetical protein EON61_24760, partial [Alphaproteobacteria bacterium]